MRFAGCPAMITLSTWSTAGRSPGICIGLKVSTPQYTCQPKKPDFSPLLITAQAPGCSRENPHNSLVYSSQVRGAGVAVAVGSGVGVGGTGEGVIVGGTLDGTAVGTGIGAATHPKEIMSRRMNKTKCNIDFFIALFLGSNTPCFNDGTGWQATTHSGQPNLQPIFCLQKIRHCLPQWSGRFPTPDRQW